MISDIHLRDAQERAINDAINQEERAAYEQEDREYDLWRDNSFVAHNDDQERRFHARWSREPEVWL